MFVKKKICICAPNYSFWIRTTEAQRILTSQMLIKGFQAGSPGRLKVEEALVGSWVGAGDFPFITLPS